MQEVKDTNSHSNKESAHFLQWEWHFDLPGRLFSITNNFSIQEPIKSVEDIKCMSYIVMSCCFLLIKSGHSLKYKLPHTSTGILSASSARNLDGGGSELSFIFLNSRQHYGNVAIKQSLMSRWLSGIASGINPSWKCSEQTKDHKLHIKKRK